MSGRVGTPETAKEKRILDLQAMMTSPFPERAKAEIDKEYAIMLEEEISELEDKMTWDEAVKSLGLFDSGLRKRALKKIQDKRAAAAKAYECKMITQQKVVVQKKLTDLGSFTIPCTIRNQTF